MLFDILILVSDKYLTAPHPAGEDVSVCFCPRTGTGSPTAAARPNLLIRLNSAASLPGPGNASQLGGPTPEGRDSPSTDVSRNDNLCTLPKGMCKGFEEIYLRRYEIFGGLQGDIFT